MTKIGRINNWIYSGTQKIEIKIRRRKGKERWIRKEKNGKRKSKNERKKQRKGKEKER